ncbi:MAG: hypothetical protein ACQEXK_16680 [Bacillota bacterium]
MDGHNIKDVSLKSLRGQMGIVSQDIILFNGSTRDNIVYGKLNATDDEIIESAKAANAHDFISAFPDGYDSQIRAWGQAFRRTKTAHCHCQGTFEKSANHHSR